MSRTAIPTYRIEMTTPGFATTPAGWRKEYGRPTDENLAEYVRRFAESTAAGGCNAHLGPMTVAGARIVKQATGEAVATYTAPAVTIAAAFAFLSESLADEPASPRGEIAQADFRASAEELVNHRGELFYLSVCYELIDGRWEGFTSMRPAPVAAEVA